MTMENALEASGERFAGSPTGFRRMTPYGGSTAARRRGQQGDRQRSITPRERTDKLTMWSGGAARLPHDGIQALPVRASSAPRCAQHGEFLRSTS